MSDSTRQSEWQKSNAERSKVLLEIGETIFLIYFWVQCLLSSKKLNPKEKHLTLQIKTLTWELREKVPTMAIVTLTNVTRKLDSRLWYLRRLGQKFKVRLVNNSLGQ